MKDMHDKADSKRSLSASVASLRTNKATEDEASKVIFLISWLKACTGLTKQRLICRMVLYAFRNDPSYLQWRDIFEREWSRLGGNGSDNIK